MRSSPFTDVETRLLRRSIVVEELGSWGQDADLGQVGCQADCTAASPARVHASGCETVRKGEELRFSGSRITHHQDVHVAAGLAA